MKLNFKYQALASSKLKIFMIFQGLEWKAYTVESKPIYILKVKLWVCIRSASFVLKSHRRSFTNCENSVRPAPGVTKHHNGLLNSCWVWVRLMLIKLKLKFGISFSFLIDNKVLCFWMRNCWHYVKICK